jgi:hypothetical protein
MLLRRVAFVFALVLTSAIAFLPGAMAQTAPPLSNEVPEAHPAFVAEMTGFEEVPGAATRAKGVFGAQVSSDGNTVYYTITLTDSSSQLVAAHLHLAPRGEAGPVVVPLCATPAKPCQTEGVVSSGSFTSGDFIGPFANDVLSRLISEAMNGMVYVNVHSTKYAAGEARGQLADLSDLIPVMEPSGAS